MPLHNATHRFSSRVENYVRYRPGYPSEVLQLLREHCGLVPEHVVADIACGTGLFTRMLLENGNRVFGVEPNADMRKAGEEYLAAYPHFTSIDGTAEATTLPGHCVDMVTAAQAAHWFDREKARKEFVRTLKPGGWVVLLWNERRLDSTPFLRDYENLVLTYGTDYQDIRHEHTTSNMGAFFAPSDFEVSVFELRQELDYMALKGRLLSSSYAPQPGDPKHEPMLNELRQIFERDQQDGHIYFDYDTRVFYGRIA